MNQYDLNQALEAFLKLTRDENPYAINLFEPMITVQQAKEMFDLRPQVIKYLEEHPAKAPLKIRKRS